MNVNEIGLKIQNLVKKMILLNTNQFKEKNIIFNEIKLLSNTRSKLIQSKMQSKLIQSKLIQSKMQSKIQSKMQSKLIQSKMQSKMQSKLIQSKLIQSKLMQSKLIQSKMQSKMQSLVITKPNDYIDIATNVIDDEVISNQINKPIERLIKYCEIPNQHIKMVVKKN